MEKGARERAGADEETSEPEEERGAGDGEGGGMGRMEGPPSFPREEKRGHCAHKTHDVFSSCRDTW